MRNLSIRHKLLIFLGAALISIFSITYALFAQSFQTYSDLMLATEERIISPGSTICIAVLQIILSKPIPALIHFFPPDLPRPVRVP